MRVAKVIPVGKMFFFTIVFWDVSKGGFSAMITITSYGQHVIIICKLDLYFFLFFNLVIFYSPLYESCESRENW